MVLTSTLAAYPIIEHLIRFNSTITILINLFPLWTFINVYKEKEESTSISKATILTGFLKNLLWVTYWEYTLEESCSACYLLCTLFSVIYIIWLLYYESKKQFGKFMIYTAAAIQIMIVIGIIFGVCYLELGDLQMGLFAIAVKSIIYIVVFNDLKKYFKEKNYKKICNALNILEIIKYGGWLYFSSMDKEYYVMTITGLGLILYISIIVTALIVRGIKTEKPTEENEKELIEINEEEKEK